MTDRADAMTDLEAVLVEAVRALAVLDAEAIEALAEFLEGNPGGLKLPLTGAHCARVRSGHWILGHLLDGTRQRLEMLRRVSAPRERFGGYAGRPFRGEASRRAAHFAAPGLEARREDLTTPSRAGTTAN